MNHGPTALPNVDETIRFWSVTATADRHRQELFAKIVRRLMIELEQVERGHVLGRTTVALWHPDGKILKAFLNDRQV